MTRKYSSVWFGFLLLAATQTLMAQADFSSQLLSMVSAPACKTGCTVTIPPGTHAISTDVVVSMPNVHLVGNNSAVLVLSGAKLVLQGDGDSIEGARFDLLGGYRRLSGLWIRTGKNIIVRNNQFIGASPYAIFASYVGPGLRIDGNAFAADAQGMGPGPMTIDFTEDFSVTGNHFKNTHGFGIPMLGSTRGTVSGNDFYQPMFTAASTGNPAANSFSATLPSYVTRLAAHVDDKPTPSDAGSNSGGNNWTIKLEKAPIGSPQVKLVGWQALENIQVNSYSSEITVSNNTIDGTGDTGIDVVSDYHANILSTQRASGASTEYKFTGTVTHFAAVTINGRMMTGSQITNGGPEKQADGSWLVHLTSPVPPGAYLSLVDLSIGKNDAKDFPHDVLITQNTVKNARGSGIAIEIPAQDIKIIQNAIENCGMGVTDVSYSSGIFVAGPTRVLVANNRIINSATVMRKGISLIGFYDDTGSTNKDAVLMDNQFIGNFEHRYFLPTPAPRTRQVGVDVKATRNSWPAGANFALFKPEGSSSDAYFVYKAHLATITLHPEPQSGVSHSVEINLQAGANSTAELQLQHPELLKDALLRVSFRAYALDGAGQFSINTFAGGVYFPKSIPITMDAWREFSITLSTTGLDLSKPILLDFTPQGAGGFNVLMADFQITATSLN
jgi:hypothetical protein